MKKKNKINQMMKHEKETFEFFFCWFCPWNYFSDGSFWMKVRIILCKSVQGLISLYHFDRFAFSSSHKSPSPLHGSCFNAIFEKKCQCDHTISLFSTRYIGYTNAEPNATICEFYLGSAYTIACALLPFIVTG